MLTLSWTPGLWGCESSGLVAHHVVCLTILRSAGCVCLGPNTWSERWKINPSLFSFYSCAQLGVLAMGWTFWTERWRLTLVHFMFPCAQLSVFAMGRALGLRGGTNHCMMLLFAGQKLKESDPSIVESLPSWEISILAKLVH